MSIIAICRLRIGGVFFGALLLVFSVSTSVAQSVPVLGYVAAKNANPKRLAVFRQGLAELGYAEGKNIKIEYREAVLDSDYDAVVAALIGNNVSIILAANIASAVAAAKATSSVPIVMLAVNDPVGAGLVKSLERPGTNVTGTTMYAPHFIEERLQILTRLVPNLDKVAMVLNGNNANNAAQFERARSQGTKFRIEVQALDIRRPQDVEAAFDKAQTSAQRRSSMRSTASSTRNALRSQRARRNASCRCSTRTSNMSWLVDSWRSGRVTTRAITAPPHTWTRSCGAQIQPSYQSRAQRNLPSV
jgi:ABC-type uncharacterized transport system substrate-binding protein